METLSETPHGYVDVTIHGVDNVPVPDMDAAAGRSLYYCFTAALLLLYYCFTTAPDADAAAAMDALFGRALLLLYCCFTTVLRLRLMWVLLQQWTPSIRSLLDDTHTHTHTHTHTRCSNGHPLRRASWGGLCTMRPRSPQ